MKKLYIVVSLIVSENQYQQEQAAAAKEAAQRLGAEIEVIYGGNDAIAQGQQLLELIQSSGRRPDAIICHPVGTSLMQVAQGAVTAGIGLAIANREVDYVAKPPKKSKIPIFAVPGYHHAFLRTQSRQP